MENEEGKRSKDRFLYAAEESVIPGLTRNPVFLCHLRQELGGNFVRGKNSALNRARTWQRDEKLTQTENRALRTKNRSHSRAVGHRG
jgi:hypothetical protein